MSVNRQKLAPICRSHIKKAALRKKKYKIDDKVAEDIIKGRTTKSPDAEGLTHDELFGKPSPDRSLEESETDERDDEGLGDGKMGRTTSDL
jgi:hypothetical protein